MIFFGPVYWGLGLPMRRALIGQRDRGAGFGLALGLAFQKDSQAARLLVQQGALFTHDVGEVVDGAGQVGDFFLKV